VAGGERILTRAARWSRLLWKRYLSHAPSERNGPRLETMRFVLWEETFIMAEVGTKLIFENERVRVWEFTLQPGEDTGAHRHEHDYFFYPIEGGTLEVTRASGITRVTLNPGEVYFRKGGDTHSAKNIDDHRYHELLVELKG
jgi:quercetin dioxygenase-like cupin family protein